MIGATQAEREANCQQRLAKNRALTPAERLTAVLEGLNYTFQGGFGGIYHHAKKRAKDESLPADARTLFQEAADWGMMAFTLEKKGHPMALDAAVNAAKCSSKATGMIALGWVPDAGEST